MRERSSTGGHQLDIHPLVMDLSSLEQVRDAAKNILEKEEKLDILVNCAATYVHADAGPRVCRLYSPRPFCRRASTSLTLTKYGVTDTMVIK